MNESKLEFKNVEWGESCDNCTNQEDGGHYCLLHGIPVKNMDIVQCHEWNPVSIVI